MFHDCNRRVDGKLRRALADKELSLLIAEVAANGAARRRRSSTAATPAAAPATRSSGRAGWKPDVDHVEPALARPRRGGRHGPAVDGVPARRAGVVDGAAAAARRPRRLPLVRDGQGAPGRRGDAGSVLRRPRRRPRRARHRAPRTARCSTRCGRGSSGRPQDQRPELFPLDPGGLGDALFLDGAVAAGRRVVHGQPRLRRVGGRRRLVHGLRDPVGDEAFVLACTAPDGEPAGCGAGHGRRRRPLERRADRVGARRRGLRAPSSPTCRCRPPRSSSIRGSIRSRATRDLAPTAADVAAVHDAVRRGRSPRPGPTARRRRTSRVVDPSTGSAGAAAPAGRRPRAGRRRDQAGRRQPGRQPGRRRRRRREGAARLVVSRLEHVARWEQIRSLGDHPSPLADAVTPRRLRGDGGRDAADRPTAGRSRPTAATSSRTDRGADGSWQPPRVFVELRNESDDDLYVAVLDLTDRFRCHAVLPTELARTRAARSPCGRARRSRRRCRRGARSCPGAAARDWLKVVVSDVDFDATSFDLAALDEPVARGASVARRRRATPSSGSPHGPVAATSAPAARRPPWPAGPPRPSPSRPASR